MEKSKEFLKITGEAAKFAAREYFRPFILIVSLFRRKAILPVPRPAGDIKVKDGTREQLERLIREKLSRTRHKGSVLLTLCISSIFAGMIATTVLLSQVMQVENGSGLAVVLGLNAIACLLALWFARSREDVVELKTVRRITEMVDAEVVDQMAKKLIWGDLKPKKERRRSKRAR